MTSYSIFCTPRKKGSTLNGKCLLPQTRNKFIPFREATYSEVNQENRALTFHAKLSPKETICMKC